MAAAASFRSFCLSVNSTSAWPPTNAAATSPEPPAPPRRTRVILPKKKPLKWSTGVAPGDYGGPPTTTKLRRYWGGENPDPLASGDFMWNKNFMARMRRLIDDPVASTSSPAIQSSSSEGEDSGFLSLNRMMNLDNVEIDLSKELAPPPKPVLEHLVEAARNGQSMSKSPGSPKWRLIPTRREQGKWDRAAKAATGGSDVMLREVRKVRGDPQVLATQSREQYFKLKRKLQILTIGIGGVGVVSAYLSYSAEMAASFGAGLLGSLIYIRMLGNTVDSMADGAKGLVKGAVGQPRLLVPVVLVMIYNRWNETLVPDYGFMHLDLIPMLVGFFTYKVATFAQAIEDAFNVDRKET